MLLSDIKAAVAATNPAQRNWDRSRDIPKEHMDLFEEIIRLAPTKQNETHYKVFMFKDPTTIREIYDKTNYFGVPPAKEGDDPTAFTNNQGITKKKTEKNEIVCKDLGKNLYFNNLCEKHKIYYKSRLDGVYIDKKNMMHIELSEKQKIENFSKCGICRNELWNTIEYRKRKIYQEIQEI